MLASTWKRSSKQPDVPLMPQLAMCSNILSVWLEKKCRSESGKQHDVMYRGEAVTKEAWIAMFVCARSDRRRERIRKRVLTKEADTSG